LLERGEGSGHGLKFVRAWSQPLPGRTPQVLILDVIFRVQVTDRLTALVGANALIKSAQDNGKPLKLGFGFWTNHLAALSAILGFLWRRRFATRTDDLFLAHAGFPPKMLALPDPTLPPSTNAPENRKVTKDEPFFAPSIVSGALKDIVYVTY
jgi:hypothetical protein